MKKGNLGMKISTSRLTAFAFTIALLIHAPVELMADTTLQLGLTQPNVPAGSSQSAFLQWTAASDGIYKVQSNTNLDGSSPWITEEPVQANVGPIRWMAPESIEKSKYYRLLLPQPDIFSVEPALLTTSGGTVYLIGQGLSTNGQMRVAGLVLPPNVLQPGSVYSFVVPTLAAGTYDVEWLVNGQVAATGYKLFSITAEVQPAGVAQRPYEIPQEPLASPDSSLARIKETGQWWAGRANKRSYTSGKYAIELDNFTTGEVQEGKKGLNAVNVKLASRVIGTRALPAVGTGPNGQGLRLSGGGESSEFVQACSGEVQVEAVDLVVPGRGLDFVWGRKYRSNVGRNYPTGNGWSFCYDVRCVQNGADMDVFDGSGRHDTYFHQTNGTFARDEFFNEGTLTKQVFRLTFPDTSFWAFNPLDGSAKAGKIAISQDRNGNALQFTYDSSGRLATVIDTLNRTNTITYDSSGRIYSVADFSGRSVTYQYYSSASTNGNDGDLLSVTSPPVTGTPNGNDFPAGKTTTYTYSTGFTNDSENHLLLTVTDPKGQLVRSHIYQHNQTDLEFLRCISTTVGSSNEVETLCYVPQTPAPSNNFAVMRTIVNDCVGDVTECFYDARNRLLKLRQFTGRAIPGIRTTASANRPTGKLRAGDPDSFDTQWTWNIDSLWTMIQRPAGSSARMVHERDFDKNTAPRMKGNLRIYRELPCCDGADTDGDGVIDTTELTTTFQYDPRFGSPDMDCRTTTLPRKGWDGTIKGRFASGPRQTVSLDGTCCPSCRKGWDGTIKGNFAELDGTGEMDDAGKLTSGQPAITDNHKGLLVSFAIISSNPRGIATMTTYDPHGNPQECTVHWTVDTMAPDVMVTDYEYNPYGQMTACVNPVDGNGQRRRDQWSYYSTGPQTGYCRDWTVDATGPTVILSSYEYDAVGNITRCVDPMGNDTLCTYNSLNQLVRVQSPIAIGGTAIRYATACFYDANDNPTHVRQENRDQTGALGKPASFDVFYDFDVLNCVTQRTETISGNSSAVTQITYDACRQLSLVRSPECVAGHDLGNVVQCLWDERGLLYRCVRAPGTTAQSTDQVDYDSLGNRLYLFGGLEASSGARSTQYGYDGFERCVSVTDAMGNVATCAYDRNNNLVFSRVSGETNDVPGGAGNRRLTETHYVFDSLDRCVTTRAAFFDPVSGLPLTDGEATTACSYAQNGELTGVVDDNGHATHYAYDTVCRLSMITDAKSNTMVYAYDSNGNVLS
ncbi:MAG: wapA, partial [Pedosphaera sp.]|nr:wapA [Pedosphaera sp.]